MEEKNPNNRKFLWGATIVCLSLAILDMMYLRDVFVKYAGFHLEEASIIAFALATVANVTAILWGREIGFKRKGRSFMWSWIILGLIYFMIRGVAIYNEIIATGTYDFKAIISQLLPVIILTISYVGTGTTLKWAGKQLWDADIYNFLVTQRAFHEAHEDIANNRAALWQMIETLQKYDNNYISLDKQYEDIKNSIRKSEKATMATITGKVIAANPSIDPVDANLVMDRVLEERDNENERIHKNQ